MTNALPLPIDIVSDVVCPWCYIGKRLLELAVAQSDIAVDPGAHPAFIARASAGKNIRLPNWSARAATQHNRARRAAGLYAGEKKPAAQHADCHRLILGEPDWHGGSVK
jgi:predicted DsbA family dithiol-disulfide isomerase